MDPTMATDTISSAGAALSAALRAAPDAAVASCPGWTVATLATHLAAVHAWAAANVAAASPEMQPFPTPPPDLAGEDLAVWADEQRALLLDTLAAADPAHEAWTFAGPAPAMFWWRRQCHETAMHAWDATAALGSPWTIPGDVAADGLVELFDFLPRKFEDVSWGAGKTIHFHRTDGDAEWVLTVTAPPEIREGHVKSDLAVRGSAADLWLWAMNRPAEVELIGDTSLAAAWADHVKI
jgi:uncharacterized protein (TIGR03083 family)